MRHRVRTQSWINGILNTVDHLFESFEEAVAHSVAQTSTHASGSDAHSIKIYNQNDELVHQVDSLPPQATYA